MMTLMRLYDDLLPCIVFIKKDLKKQQPDGAEVQQQRQDLNNKT